MNTYKRMDHLIDAMGKFILLHAFSKVLFVTTIIILFSSSTILYKKFAFDHIKVHAVDEQAFFDLKVTSEFQEFSSRNLSTPYSIRIPKGEKIEVEITNNSARICGILKSGNSSLQISHSIYELKLQRDGHYLQGGCL